MSDALSPSIIGPSTLLSLGILDSSCAFNRALFKRETSSFELPNTTDRTCGGNDKALLCSSSAEIEGVKDHEATADVMLCLESCTHMNSPVGVINEALLK